MPEFVIGARGHDFGRHTPDELFASIGKAGFACTQLAYTKAINRSHKFHQGSPIQQQGILSCQRKPC